MVSCYRGSRFVSDQYQSGISSSPFRSVPQLFLLSTEFHPAGYFNSPVPVTSSRLPSFRHYWFLARLTHLINNFALYFLEKLYGKPAHTLKISLDVSMLEGNLSSFSFPLSPSPPLPPLSLCRTISQTSLDLSIMRQRGRLCIFAVTLSKAETELQILITAGEGDVCPQYKHNQYQYLYNIEWHIASFINSSIKRCRESSVTRRTSEHGWIVLLKNFGNIFLSFVFLKLLLEKYSLTLL